MTHRAVARRAGHAEDIERIATFARPEKAAALHNTGRWTLAEIAKQFKVTLRRARALIEEGNSHIVIQDQ